ncbi:MAG: N-acetylmuramoyl-L-alanine amidase [Oscillospiraceae bacterium]|nr:N-acetylmuramoyl-L-alanine amidase [Oscillospiraceae bacterium]
MTKVLIIDAGHGGKDPGAVNVSRYEKDDVLKISLAVQADLKIYDLTVVMTRDTDVSLELSERADIAKDNKADLMLSIHRNSHTTGLANGIEVCIHKKASAESKEAAKVMISKIVPASGMKDRGVKAEKGYAVLKNLDIPGMLLELGFISNSKDNTLFDSNFDSIVEAIVEALVDILDLKVAEEDKEEITTVYNNGHSPSDQQDDGKLRYVFGEVSSRYV